MPKVQGIELQTFLEDKIWDIVPYLYETSVTYNLNKIWIEWEKKNKQLISVMNVHLKKNKRYKAIYFKIHYGKIVFI